VVALIVANRYCSRPRIAVHLADAIIILLMHDAVGSAVGQFFVG
jgi:hypothetical protein